MVWRIAAIVDEDHKVVIELPTDIPVGQRIEVIVQTEHVPDMPTSPDTTISGEQARAILAAKGLLVDFNFEIADDFVPLDAETLLAHGTLPEDAPSSLDLINEDRGDLIPIIPIHTSEK